MTSAVAMPHVALEPLDAPAARALAVASRAARPSADEDLWLPAGALLDMQNFCCEGFWRVICKTSGNTVGASRVYRCRHGVSFRHGLGILPNYRRQGYGRAALARSLAEAFEATAAQEARAEIRSSNEGSIRLHQSLGFHLERRQPMGSEANVTFIIKREQLVSALALTS